MRRDGSGSSGRVGVRRERDSLRRGFTQTSRCAPGARRLVCLALPRWCTVIARSRRFGGSGLLPACVEVFQCSGEQRAAFRSHELQNLGRRRFSVVNRLDLPRSEVLIEDLLQGICVGRRIGPRQAQAITHLAPLQLLFGYLVVAAIFQNQVEELQKVDGEVSHLGFRFERRASCFVEILQLGYEFIVLGSAIDGMLDGLLRCHSGANYRRAATNLTTRCLCPV